MENYIKDYCDYLNISGKSERTITIYKSILVKFLKLYPKPRLVTRQQIIKFMLQRGKARTIQQTHGALNHFYGGVLQLSYIKKIPQPKAPDFIPNILSQIEVFNLFQNMKNLKHEALLQLMYSGAFRVGETLNIKLVDVSKTKNQIKIISGKGNKTAYVPIPEATKLLLREYYIKYKPKVYLFEGPKGGKYSASSVRKVLKQALLRINITRNIRVHDLRHSRATHLLENGMDIKILKDILRHKKMETTERYTHLTTSSLEKAMRAADIKMQLTLPASKQLQAA
ncbi:tyrosine-type recombinase/integrase [Algibacter sp. PT7-4]|uniref:tyrosine-type recombinase/integrase n=1 Tax=Algibacter ulvanivorans TaxID=3400999 RepID=UPI003AAF7AC0